MAGILIEKSIMARNVDSLNRSAITTDFDVDGGGLVVLGDIDEKEKDVFKATKPTAETDDVWIAYNPSEHLTNVNGKMFAGLSKDPRDYTNLQKRVFDVFKPQAGDIIGILEANVVGDTATKGQFLEPTASDTKFTAKGSQTAKVKTSFKVIDVTTLQFPKAKEGIGMDFVKLYICEAMPMKME